MENKKFYITTPIYYPSDNFHIGHCYTTIIADSIARFKRLSGYDTFFLTGTDEHGQKIERKAKEKGVTPKEYVDKIVDNAKDLWASLNISYDKFIRTTDKEHEEVVQKIFKKLYDQGDIYKGEYKGLYCTPCESFWTETQLDENGKCPDCHREVHEVKEEAYFFKLSKYQAWLEEFLDSHPDFIEPTSRKNEMINNFIKPGLSDLCVSRTSFKWGVPVSFDEKHVVYVWIDALSNYISALGYLTDDDTLFKKYWPADLHIVGKEIVRFHTIIWPIMLKALDLPLPKKVFGHGWLVIDGGKISKSLGNYKDPREYINAYGVDAVRYYALREVPFGSDGNFSEEALVTRTNSDLANILGNLVNRTIGMVNKYFDGKVTNTKIYEDIDKDLIDYATSLKENVTTLVDNLELSNAIDKIFDLFRKCNKYIDETMPWALAKDEAQQDRLAEVLYNLVESITIGGNLLKSFMPETTDKILAQLYPANPEAGVRDFDDLATFGLRETGLKVTETPEILFARLDFEKDLKEKVDAIQEAQKKANGVTEYPQVEVKPEITFDDFEKVQFRVAKVLTCEAVKKTKLLKFELQIGDEKRTIVSGIQKYYKPEELIGNESQGMIISAWDDKDNLSVLTLEKDIIEGAEIG